MAHRSKPNKHQIDKQRSKTVSDQSKPHIGRRGKVGHNAGDEKVHSGGKVGEDTRVFLFAGRVEADDLCAGRQMCMKERARCCGPSGKREPIHFEERLVEPGELDGRQIWSTRAQHALLHL